MDDLARMTGDLSSRSSMTRFAAKSQYSPARSARASRLDSALYSLIGQFRSAVLYYPLIFAFVLDLALVK